jgi:hypothetical protein
VVEAVTQAMRCQQVLFEYGFSLSFCAAFCLYGLANGVERHMLHTDPDNPDKAIRKKKRGAMDWTMTHTK